MYTFSAKGPWDAIVVNATTLESAPGRFATAAFITPPRPAQVEEVYPERIYPECSSRTDGLRDKVWSDLEFGGLRVSLLSQFED
jgi:hypothetical protein